MFFAERKVGCENFKKIGNGEDSFPYLRKALNNFQERRTKAERVLSSNIDFYRFSFPYKFLTTKSNICI